MTTVQHIPSQNFFAKFHPPLPMSPPSSASPTSSINSNAMSTIMENTVIDLPIRVDSIFDPYLSLFWFDPLEGGGSDFGGGGRREYDDDRTDCDWRKKEERPPMDSRPGW